MPVTTGEARRETEAQREGAAALVEHRVAHRGGARADGGDQPAAGEHAGDGSEHRRRLEHRAQVHRRLAGEVDRPGTGDHGGRPGILGVGTGHHHQHLDVDVEALGPRHRRGDQRPRLLEGVGRRQHDHP